MTKTIIFSVIISSFYFTSTVNAEDIILEGSYQGKNLYVQNPFTDAGVGFCAKNVKVNGRVTTTEINSSAFEIDFSLLNLKVGECVSVSITHTDGCAPKVINPDVLNETPDLSVRLYFDDNLIKWEGSEQKICDKGKNSSSTTYMEHFRWNKWVEMGEAKCMASDENGLCSFKPVLITGKNRFRLKHINADGNPAYSKEIVVNSDKEPCSYELSSTQREITFSCETVYEIYDMFGKIVKKGWNDVVDISSFDKGEYYLSFDNQTTSFTKRKK